MIAKSHLSSRRAQGFSLVEIMVALVIGMIAMLVVLQTFQVSEGLKRSTTGGDDAQVAGAVGLFQLERDLAQSGYGISATGLIGCTVTLPAASGSVAVNLAPVTINSSAITVTKDPKTDTVLIVYGNPVGPTEGDLLNTATTTTYSMQSPSSFATGDFVVASAQATPPASPSNCASMVLDKVKTGGTTASPNIVVTTGASGVTGGILYDLGASPTIIGYAVVGGNLVTCSFLTTNCKTATNWTPIAGNISSMKAVYGHDANSAPMTDIVDTWDQTVPATACAWMRTSAVSIALIARNSEFSTSNVTANSPVWADPAWASGTLTYGSPAAVVTSIPIDLSANVGLSGTATWQNYRYKIYSTVAPLRNVTWEAVNYMAGTSQC